MAKAFLDWNFLELGAEKDLSVLGRTVLNALLKKNQLELELDFEPNFGFPRLKEKDGSLSAQFFCSISHTEHAAVAAISNSPVGIDIEKKNRSVRRVLKRIATEEEIINLNQSVFNLKSDVEDPGLFLWTGKEAFAKAIGLGLRKGLLPFQIKFGNRAPFPIQTTTQGPLHLEAPRISYYIQNGYLIGLVFSDRLP